MRILKSMGALLSAQLNKAVHPLLSIGEVRNTLADAEAASHIVLSMCERVGNDPANAKDETIVGLLGSTEGEQMAREYLRLKKVLDQRVLSWDDGRALGRGQVEAYEPTPLVVRDRGVAFEFSAFLRHAEALSETLDALKTANQLQFWIHDGKYQYAGQPEEGGR